MASGPVASVEVLLVWTGVFEVSHGEVPLFFQLVWRIISTTASGIGSVGTANLPFWMRLLL